MPPYLLGSDFHARQLRVNVVGDRLLDADIKAMELRLPEFGLDGVQPALAQSGQVMPDMNAVKRDLLNDFLQSNRADIAERDAHIAALRGELQNLRKSVAAQLPLKDIYYEVRSQFPQALQVSVASGFRTEAEKAQTPSAPGGERPLLLVQLKLRGPLSAGEQERLRLGLRTRAGLADLEDVRLEVSVLSPVKVAVSKKHAR